MKNINYTGTMQEFHYAQRLLNDSSAFMSSLTVKVKGTFGFNVHKLIEADLQQFAELKHAYILTCKTQLVIYGVVPRISIVLSYVQCIYWYS